MNAPDRLLRHSFLLMVASQVSNISNVLFHMVMGRWLIPAEYGILSSMLGVILIAGLPLNALSNSLAFFSAQMVQRGQTSDILPLVRTWALKLLIVILPLLAIGILCRQPLAQFFKLSDQTPIILALVVLALSFYPPIVGGALQGIQAFGWGSLSAMSWGVVRLVVGGTLVYHIAASANWALFGQGLGVVVSVAIGLAGLGIILRSIPSMANVLPATTGYLLHTLMVLACFSFLMNADVLIVKHYFDPDTSGLFARAGTIGRTIIFLPMPIAGALFPKTVSNGSMSAQHGKLLIKALCYAALLIIPAALFCTLFPQVPLGILYHDWQPDENMSHLVRCTIWAMAPLSLIYIIMNFELSQNRFGITGSLFLGVVGYLIGVLVWHASVLQIVAVLAVISVLTMLALVKVLPWRAGRVGDLILPLLPL